MAEVEFFQDRDWFGDTARFYGEELHEYFSWYRENCFKTFDESGRTMRDANT